MTSDDRNDDSVRPPPERDLPTPWASDFDGRELLQEVAVATRAIHIDPNVKVSELVGRLGDDSQRLLNDEFRLAKLEMGQSARVATRGVLWLSLGFGTAVIALVAVTVLLTVVFGNGIFGRAWPGALIAGVIDLAIGGALIVVGAGILKRTDYTLGESRE